MVNGHINNYHKQSSSKKKSKSLKYEIKVGDQFAFLYTEPLSHNIFYKHQTVIKLFSLYGHGSHFGQ